MKFIWAVLFAVIEAVNPDLVVKTLNLFYSEVSGSDSKLYSLVLPLLPLNASESYDSEMILLLNNTYQGLALHVLEVNSSVLYPSILSHTVPEFYQDITATNFILGGLMDHINTDISAPIFEVKVQNMTEFDFYLYSGNVIVNNTEYRVDVLRTGNHSTSFVSQKENIHVSNFVIGADTRVKSILFSMVFGFLATFIGLCVFYKRNQRLPFISKQEARSAFNMENIKT